MILHDGQLFSRSQAKIEGKMIHDNASQTIIDQTNVEYQDYVRLYFRPKSLTQYHNEGFKTSDQLSLRQLDAQCPVPVFLFFDLRRILNHTDCQFSEKSLAFSDYVQLFSSPEEFSKLPFLKFSFKSRKSSNRRFLFHKL